MPGGLFGILFCRGPFLFCIWAFKYPLGMFSGAPVGDFAGSAHVGENIGNFDSFLLLGGYPSPGGRRRTERVLRSVPVRLRAARAARAAKCSWVRNFRSP